MSHTTTLSMDIKGNIQIGNICETIAKHPDICRALGITSIQGVNEAKTGTYKQFQLYQKQQLSGVAIQFEGWKYPVILQPDGKIAMDTYEGNWGNKQKNQSLSIQQAREADELQVNKLMNTVKGLHAVEIAKQTYGRRIQKYDLTFNAKKQEVKVHLHLKS